MIVAGQKNAINCYHGKKELGNTGSFYFLAKDGVHESDTMRPAIF